MTIPNKIAESNSDPISEINTPLSPIKYNNTISNTVLRVTIPKVIFIYSFCFPMASRSCFNGTDIPNETGNNVANLRVCIIGKASTVCSLDAFFTK